MPGYSLRSLWEINRTSLEFSRLAWENSRLGPDREFGMAIDYWFVNETIKNRLVDRFELSEYAKENTPWYMSKVILPVTSMDDLLSTVHFQTTNTDLTAAAGTYVPIFTVPKGKRWKLLGYHKGITIATSRVRMKPNADDAGFAYKLTPSITAEENQKGLNTPMEEDGTIGMQTTGNGGDAAVNFEIIYTEEDAF